MSELLQPTTADVVADYDRLRDDCALIELEGIALLGVEGDDRKGWLQGQVTNNLRHFESGNSTAFCFCESTGHLVSVCDAWALPDRIVATLAAPTLAPTLQRIEQMTVLEDVRGVDLSKEYRLISIQGPRATARLSEFMPLPSLDAGVAEFEGAEVFTLRSNRTGMGGWDVWVPGAKRKALKVLRDTFPTIGFAAYDVARLEAGIPLWDRDMNGRTMPPELGSAFQSRHVSLSKGCYMGQEVLQRIASRGHTNKTWVGLVADRPIPVGGAVAHHAKPDIGRVTSAGYSPDYGHIGAAMIRNEAAFPNEIVRCGDVEAEVRLMPILRFE